MVVFYVLLRIKAPRSRLRIPGKAGMEVIRAVGALVFLSGFYAAAMLLPRPMVGLSLSDSDRLSIDFHSHTNHSHDGWSLFTAPRNRRWHEGGGFDVGYVTDHYTWRGVDEAVLGNPRLAGARTVLLSGAEIRLRRRHTNVLGDRTRYAFALDSTWHHLDPDSLNEAFHRGAPVPTMLYTIPGPVDQIVPLREGAPAGVVGVELNDGAPRGLEQAKGERGRIVAISRFDELGFGRWRKPPRVGADCSRMERDGGSRLAGDGLPSKSAMRSNQACIETGGPRLLSLRDGCRTTMGRRPSSQRPFRGFYGSTCACSPSGNAFLGWAGRRPLSSAAQVRRQTNVGPVFRAGSPAI